MAQDKIILEGMAFYGYHGVREEEKRLGQRFLVDVELALDVRAAGRSDRLEDTVDYGEVYRQVKAIMEGPSHNLLESLAETIATTLLADDRIEAVRVRVRKPFDGVYPERSRGDQDRPGVAIKGSILSSAVVEVVRRRAIDSV